MRKFIWFLVLCFIPILASAEVVDSQYLEDSTYGVWNALVMGVGTGTYTSSGVPMERATGECSVLVLTTAGTGTLTYEVSNDNTTFYAPVSTANVAVNSIGTAEAANKWIYFTPVPSNWIRFKYVLTKADSTVSVIFTNTED